jgi:hypothetical protein
VLSRLLALNLDSFLLLLIFDNGVLQADFLPSVDSLSLRVHNYNNYKADLIHSGSLPAEGFSMKYDPNDEYIAIGCYNGTKTLLAAKDSTRMLK